MNERVSMKKYIVSYRCDANGARLNNLIAAIFLAKKLDCHFLFEWESVARGGFTVEQLEQDKIHKKFKNQRMIGSQVDSKEDIFDQKFLDKHYIDIKTRDEKQVWNFDKYPICFENFDDFKDFFNKSDFLYYDVNILNNVNFLLNNQEYKSYFKQFFKLIKFSPNINILIKKARDVSSRLENNFVAIHLRAGDIIYGDSQWTHILSVMQQAGCVHFIMELIEDIAKRNNVIIFSDDPDTVNLMIKKLNLNNVFSADQFRDFKKLSISELFMFDIALMSSAIEVYGTISNVGWLGSLIASGKYNIYIYDIINSKQQYENIKIKVSNFEFNDYQQSFSYLRLFLLAEKLNVDKAQQKKYFLQKALSYNPHNFRCQIYYAYYLAKYDKTKALENYLTSVDLEVFIHFFTLNFQHTLEGKQIFQSFFYLANKKFPCIYKIFLALSKLDNKYFQKKSFHIFLRKMLCRITFFKKYIIKIY